MLASVVALPEQLSPLRGVAAPISLGELLRFLAFGLGPPGWIAALEQSGPLASAAAALARLFFHAGPLHALLALTGLWVAGMRVEQRFGSAATAIVFLVAGLAPNLLQSAVGAGGGVMGLFGALLLDLARRGESRSLFGPLVAPILLHGVLNAVVPGDWSLVHGVGFAAGAIVGRVLGRAPEPRSDDYSGA